MSPKYGRRNQQQQQQQNVDPYNSNLTLNNQSNTFGRQYSRSQLQQVNEPQISVSQANLNQKNESTGFLSSFGTLGRKKKQQEGKLQVLLVHL